MNNILTQTIEEFISLPDIESTSQDNFQKFLQFHGPCLKSEGNTEHFCVFFLPYNKRENMIYLGHHKKANDWIPPGGHIEKGETPLSAAMREFEEELRVTPNSDSFHPFDISIKHIERKSKACKTHYDMWYLVDSEVIDFDYDKGEYYDADWFDLEEGISKITKNPEFTSIIERLRSY